MAGQWQREFFLITEDPFAVDLRVFDLWTEGYSVGRAAEVRRELFDSAGGGSRLESMASLTSYESERYESQFDDLLRQDCAQQYEAFEFLEAALADPVHFLEFCPVQLSLDARHEFVSRYYSLDEQVVREVLRLPHVLQTKPQVVQGVGTGRGDRKALAELEQIARVSRAEALKVSRIILNLQRACRWVEHAAEKHAANMSSSSGDDAGNMSGTGAFAAHGRQGVVSLWVPELEALGEVLCWRYRSLAFVLLLRFDLWGKASQALRGEHIEDVAAVLLTSGGAPMGDNTSGDARRSYVEVLACCGKSSVYGSPSEMGGGATASPVLLSRKGGVLDASTRDNLRQLEKVLRPKFQEFKQLLVQEIERNAQPPSGGTPTYNGVVANEDKSSQPARAAAFFIPGGKKTNKLDQAIHALTLGMASVQSPATFRNFFGTLADFVEKLKQLDSAGPPLDLFQRCYNAMEMLSDRDQAPERKPMWPMWLATWRAFLEFYRACAACVLLNTVGEPTVSTSSPQPSHAEAGSTLEPVEGRAQESEQEMPLQTDAPAESVENSVSDRPPVGSSSSTHGPEREVAGSEQGNRPVDAEASWPSQRSSQKPEGEQSIEDEQKQEGKADDVERTHAVDMHDITVELHSPSGQAAAANQDNRLAATTTSWRLHELANFWCNRRWQPDQQCQCLPAECMPHR